MEHHIKLFSKDKAKENLDKHIKEIHSHINNGGKVGFDWHDYIGMGQVYVTIVLDYNKKGVPPPRFPKKHNARKQ